MLIDSLGVIRVDADEPTFPEAFRQKLLGRIHALGVETATDDDRLTAFEACRQRFGAAVAAQEHRAIRGDVSDARDREIAGEVPRVLQAPALSRRYRKQEFVIFPSTERIAQRRAILDGKRVGINDGADAAGLADLP